MDATVDTAAMEKMVMAKRTSMIDSPFFTFIILLMIIA